MSFIYDFFTGIPHLLLIVGLPPPLHVSSSSAALPFGLGQGSSPVLGLISFLFLSLSSHSSLLFLVGA